VTLLTDAHFAADGGVSGFAPSATYDRLRGTLSGPALMAYRLGLAIDAGLFELDLNARRATFDQPVTTIRPKRE
jgi:hypothetical protein